MLVLGLTPAAAGVGSSDRAEADPPLALPEPPTEMPDEPIFNRPCIRGLAGPFPCHNIDLLAFLPPDEFGGGPFSAFGGPGNDSWGWTDPETRKEWALMGRADGTSFIDISDPKRPVLVADLPRHQTTTLWSDIKVFSNHAFIVKEGFFNGMQVFDLTRLRDIDASNGPVTVTADAHYNRIGNAHNLAINEDTGFAYAVGATGPAEGGNPCTTGGLHMIDINDPLNPQFAGCFDDDGYTHDVQCVIYRGPDERYQGHEICFASNPDFGPQPGPAPNNTLTAVDVTDKANPVMISRTFQGPPADFSHQGWLTEDHRYFLHNDESDNIVRFGQAPARTRTRVFDVRDLENVTVQAVHHSETMAAAHNLYVRGRYAYLTNYFDGLRIVDITQIDRPGNETAPETPELLDHQGLREVACFDTDPVRNNWADFGGSWSNYPFFRSGVVVVSGFDGLFILRTRLGERANTPPGSGNEPPGGNPHTFGCLPWGTTGN